MKKFFALTLALVMGISMISFMGCDSLKKDASQKGGATEFQVKGKMKGNFESDAVPPAPGEQKGDISIQKQTDTPEPIQKQMAEPEPIQKQTAEPEPIQKQTDTPLQKQK